MANTILIVGDSLSASYGFEKKYGWVSLMKNKIKSTSACSQVINVSTSGDTTSNGLDKLPEFLNSYQPNIVVIELGGNDALRGINLSETKTKLQQMITLSKKQKAKVLLISTRLPPNYGPFFLKRFKNIFESLSKENNIPFVPMMLKGVAEKPQLMQADGIHPKKAAQPIILNNLWPSIEPLLDDC